MNLVFIYQMELRLAGDHNSAPNTCRLLECLLCCIIKIDNEAILYLRDFQLIWNEIKSIVGADHGEDDRDVETEVSGVWVQVNNNSFPGYVF